MKKFLKNILFFIEINLLICICHVLTLLGVAFNDSGAQFDNVLEASGVILLGISPLIIGTILAIKQFKNKKDFSIYFFGFLQSLVIVGWVTFYIVNYVPNSFINRYIQSNEHKNNLKVQNKKNLEILNELKGEYIVYDSIERNGKELTVYLNANAKKVILELKIGNDVGYEIVDIFEKYDKVSIKFSKRNSDFAVQFSETADMSIILDSRKYGVYIEKMIGNVSAPVRYVNDIYIGDEKYDPIRTYKEMIEDSILEGEGIYYINDNMFLEIEKTINGVKVKEDFLQYKNENGRYSWVIKKDGIQILSRMVDEEELIFEEDLTSEEFYAEQGQYELYLKAYDENIGYFKISNSVTWSN